jgi:hypothetical protein
MSWVAGIRRVHHHIQLKILDSFWLDPDITQVVCFALHNYLSHSRNLKFYQILDTYYKGQLYNLLLKKNSTNYKHKKSLDTKMCLSFKDDKLRKYGWYTSDGIWNNSISVYRVWTCIPVWHLPLSLSTFLISTVSCYNCEYVAISVPTSILVNLPPPEGTSRDSMSLSITIFPCCP